MLVHSTAAHYWLPLGFAVTMLCGLVYVAVQQSLRQGGNDPQIQMAEDLAARASRGEALSSLVPVEHIDLGSSLAPFVIIYDEQGKVVAGSGELEGKLPQVPWGVLQYTKAHGENRLTWQPRSGVRIATVTAYFNAPTQSGYVLVGRSLREVERRVGMLGTYALAAWFTALVGSYVALALLPKPSGAT